MIVMQSTLAKEIIVGGDKGWTTKFDYLAWAAGKDFRVGDRLVFKYEIGAHNVFKVDASSFEQCVRPPAREGLTSGNDAITLETPGRKWYICGVGKHCEDGKQKLEVTVFPQLLSPAISPVQGSSSNSAANEIPNSRFH
ncbi:hypothetical protein IFM89_019809, partial [Coptis chinensis]